MLNRMKLTRQDFYYMGLFLYVLSVNIQYSYAHNEWMTAGSSMLIVLKLMKYASYILCFLCFALNRRISKFATSSIAILLLFAMYATYTGPQKAPIFYFILLITGIDTDFRKCVKIFLVVQLTTFIVYVLMSQLGVMGAEVINDSVHAGRVRSFLGYGWVNRASYSWLFICLELLYLKNNKFKIGIALLLSAINIFIFYKTNTVFSMLMTFGIIGYGYFNMCRTKFTKKRKHSYRRSKLIYIISAITFMLTIVIGVALPLVYNPNNPVMYQLNKMVTGRLALGRNAIMRYGLHLGGNKLQWVGSSTMLFGLANESEYFYVDNGFLQLALEFGLLFAGFVIFIYIMSIKKANDLRNYNLVLIYLFLSLLFVFEPYAIDFGFNPFVLYFFSTIQVSSFIKNFYERFKPVHTRHNG